MGPIGTVCCSVTYVFATHTVLASLCDTTQILYIGAAWDSPQSVSLHCIQCTLYHLVSIEAD